MRNTDEMNIDMALGDLGLDSLMGVEVKQTLERDFAQTFDMKEIRLLTFDRLQQIQHAWIEGLKSATIDVLINWLLLSGYTYM